jgi:hypothetical protein
MRSVEQPCRAAGETSKLRLKQRKKLAMPSSVDLKSKLRPFFSKNNIYGIIFGIPFIGSALALPK